MKHTLLVLCALLFSACGGQSTHSETPSSEPASPVVGGNCEAGATEAGACNFEFLNRISEDGATCQVVIRYLMASGAPSSLAGTIACADEAALREELAAGGPLECSATPHGTCSPVYTIGLPESVRTRFTAE
jgi:hypothetical protein